MESKKRNQLISKKRKEVRVKTNNFIKKGGVEDYNFYSKNISYNQRELLIDFLNWKIKNQREIIFDGYYSRNTKNDDSNQETLSDLYPLNRTTDTKKILEETFTIWSFIFPNIFLLGFSSLLNFLILCSFSRAESSTQSSLVSTWLYIFMFAFYPIFSFLIGYEAFKLLFYLLKKSVDRTRHQNFRIENSAQAIGILILMVLSPVLLYVSFNKNINLTTAYYATFILILASSFFPIILIFSYFIVTRLVETSKNKKNIKAIFSKLKEKEELPEEWNLSQVSFGNKKEMFYKVPRREVKWKKLLQPFYFKDYENNYEKFLNFKYFTSYKQRTKIKEDLKKDYKYFALILGSLIVLIVSVVFFVIYFWEENYTYKLIVLYLLFSFIIEAMIKTEQVFFDDLYMSSINDVLKKEYVVKWKIIDNHLFILTTKNKVLKSTPIIKIKSIKSDLVMPEIFLNKNQEMSLEITFENSRKFILFGYKKERLEGIRKKVIKLKNKVSSLS
ncbi:MAG: hypothetical protein K9W46_00950 [Candidatus Heimdallarchaeum endolithica]|uniref:Uncharacterized protein n=1 Tax=Candidatus Heimdallarchaeum endolithica TaxID=2876572 RepID=A0A9Y1FP36_9ARCH|nr:MAG: hypothetical protein K9W46_00950 [Candidatus Heimdallarchaeum endolithica]